MIDERETELLTHIAAGTDPITAWAALPDEDKPPEKPKWGCLSCIIGALLGLLSLWWCL